MGPMPLELVIAGLTLLVDIGILWILIKEYNYDKVIFEKQRYKKKVKKPIFEGSKLCIGEGS
jgi:hypothetical protein